MAKRSAEPINPFYVLVVILGIAFCVTACAYGMMTVRAARGGALTADIPPSDLIGFLDRYGARLMAGEIALLAVATFAAMGSDRWRSSRSTTGGQAKSGSAAPNTEFKSTTS